MKSDLARWRRELFVHGTTLLISTCLLFLFVWFAVHAASLFPGNLARARHNAERAADTFRRVCTGGDLPHYSISCGTIAADANSNVYAVAADSTMGQLADGVNLFHWMGCSQWGWCSRALELLFSYTYMLLPAVCLLLFMYAYNASRAIAAYQHVQWMNGASGARPFDPSACVLEVVHGKKVE